MKVYFNSIGVITNVDTEGDSLRQGTVGIKLEAIFSGITNTNFVATYNFKRNDNSKISNVLMDNSNTNSEKFETTFNEEWFFAKAGQTSITIFLRDGSDNIVAQGQIQFNIEENDYDEGFVPPITVIQYNQLLASIASKVGVAQKVLRVDSLPLTGEGDTYYVVKDEDSETLHNVYFYNTVTHEYVWIGSNEIDLGAFYTTEEGTAFENGIKARVTSVENELAGVAQGSPKGVYATLTALNNAYPSGTTGIYLVVADGHWYFWNGSAWTDGGLYLSNAGVDECFDSASDFPIVNKSVAGIVFKKINYTLLQGEYENGAVRDTVRSRRYDEYFEIKNRAISVIHETSESDLYESIGISYYDATKTYISSASIAYNKSGQIKIVPENAKFFRLHFRKTSSSGTGTYDDYTSANLFTRYVAGDIDIDDKLIFDSNNPCKSKYVVPLLFDKIDIPLTYGQNTSAGTINEDGKYRCYDKFFELTGKKLCVYHETSEADLYEMCYVLYFDSNKTYLSSTSFADVGFGVPIDIPSNAKYAKLSFRRCTSPTGNPAGDAYNSANLFTRYIACAKVTNIDENLSFSSFNPVANSVLASYIYEIISFDLLMGEHVTSSGIEVDSRYACYAEYFEIFSDKICVQHVTSEENLYEICYLTYYDKDKEYLSGTSFVDASFGTLITVPANAKFVRLSFRHSSGPTGNASGGAYERANLFTRYITGVSQIQIDDNLNIASNNAIKNKSLAPLMLYKIDAKLSMGSYNSSGVPSSSDNTSWKFDEYFEITAKNIMLHEERTTIDNIYELITLIYYNEYKEVISGGLYRSGKWDISLNPPANAKYFRLSFRHSSSYSDGAYLATPYPQTEAESFNRYLVGARLVDSSVFTKYKVQLDRALTFGYLNLSDVNTAIGTNKYLNFLHISDTHGSYNAYNAMLILNKLYKEGLCKFLIHTGDIVSAKYSDGTINTFLDYLNNAQGKVWAVSGNHDVGGSSNKKSECASDAQLYTKLFSVLFTNSPVTNNPEGKNYFYNDFTEEKVRFIGLHDYESDYELNPNDSSYLKYIRGRVAYSQDQIDWLITALTTLPQGYGVIIAKHTPVNYRGTTDNPFNSITVMNQNTGYFYVDKNIIPDIIQAFIDKTTISRTYSQTGNIVTTLSVEADFSNSNGEFVCYVDGHNHSDGVNFLKDYPDQLELNIACDNFHNLQNNDSKNIEGTNLQDVLNYVSVDTNRGYVYILRIGNDFSALASRRDFIGVKYRKD